MTVDLKCENKQVGVTHVQAVLTPPNGGLFGGPILPVLPREYDIFEQGGSVTLQQLAEIIASIPEPSDESTETPPTDGSTTDTPAADPLPEA